MTPFGAYLDEIKKNLAHGDATEHTHRPALKMNWNEMHVQSRREICRMSCMSESFASKPWESLEKWVQMLLTDAIALRSDRSVQLSA
jgi:hypothetical protein